MNRWVSLLKKELRLGLWAFLSPVIAFFVVVGISMYLGYRHGFGIDGIAAVAAMATGAQVLYLPLYMFHSLQAERGKLHLWLHSPLPGAALLSAKMVAGLMSMVATLIITGATGLLALAMTFGLALEGEWADVFKIGLFGGSHILIFSIWLAIVFLFFWMIFLMFTRHFGTILSFLAAFIIFIVSTSLYGRFSESWLYAKLTMWGEFHVGGMLQQWNFFSDVDMSQTVPAINLFLGSYVLETAVALLLFFAASWILDRKVEV